MNKLTALILWLLILHNGVSGQIVSGNAFIRGNYVEVGINQCGGWGTNANAPGGYHARSGIIPVTFSDNQLNLGFVADPDKNGWNVGSPNKYNGDYFMPQAPYVGWGINYGIYSYATERTNASIASCYPLNGQIPFPGGMVSVVNNPTNMQAIWQGSSTGITLKKIVTVKPNELYFTVKVVLRNTSGLPINNLYYGEYVNPDNDAYTNDIATNNLLTTNSIVSQPPTGPALVQAIGTPLGTYLGLGSRDCRARVFKGWGFTVGGVPADWYNGNGTSLVTLAGTDAAPGNLCIGIAFHVPILLSNDSTSFLYTYILKSTDFLPALTETDPGFSSNGTSYDSGDTIRPCAGTLVPLDITSGDFNTWTWSPAAGLNTTNGIHVIATAGTTPVTYNALGVGPCGTKLITIRIEPVTKPVLGGDQSVNVCPDTQANLTTLYNTAGYTVFWTNGGVPVPNPAAVNPGTYRLIAFSANNCSSDTAFVTVGNFVKPGLGADLTVFNCPGYFTDLTTQFVTAGLTTSWTSGGLPVANPSSVGAGTYQLIATSIDGCSDTANVTVNYYTKPNLGADVSNAVCPGTTVDLTALYNTAGLTVNWTSGGIPVPNPAAVGAGVYQLIGTNANGCKDTAVVTINNNPKPNLGADVSNSVCAGSTFDLTTIFNTAGLTVNWTSGGVPVPNPAAVNAGSYQLIVTNVSGCKDTAIANISLSPKPNLGADQTRNVCSGVFVDLTTIFNTAGLTTVWTIGGLPVANPAAVSAGTYQVIATNVPGCKDTALVTVTNFPKPNLGADVSNAICPGTSFDLTTVFNTAGLTTSWTTGGVPVPNPAAVGAGVYQLIGTNINGCKDTALVTITNNPKPDLGADVNNSICAGATFDLTTIFNTAGLTTNWTSGGIPVPNPAAVGAGTFQLIATNVTGCKDTALVTITFSPKPNLGADQSRSVCSGVLVDLTTIYNTAGLTVNWTTGGIPVANPAAVTPGIYQLIASNGPGCKDTALVTVTNFPKPNLGADVTNAVCPGTSFDLTTVFNTAGLTTNWTTGGVPVPNPAAVSAGVYQLIGTNVNGCKDTALVTVNFNPKPNLGADISNSVCSGTNVDLTALYNTAGLNVSWTTGGIPVANPAAVGAGTYQLIATNATGCKDTALVTIILSPKPNLGADQNRSICIGSFTDLTTIFNTSGLTVSWTIGGVPVLNPAAVAAGTYQLIASNGPGCKDTALVTVSNFPKPNLGADISNAICPGTTYDLTTAFNTAGLTTSWTIGGIPVPNPAAVSTGVYQLIGTNVDGCKDTALVTVTFNPKPNLGADATNAVCPGNTFNLTGIYNTAGLTTSWTIGGVPVPNPAAAGAGVYQLIATNTFGCKDTAIVTITLYPKPNLGPDKSTGICLGTFTNLTTEFVTAGLTTAWTNGGIPVPNPAAVAAGTYQLIATNATGCSDTALVTVFNYPKPNLGADKNVSVCPGTAVDLTTQFNTSGLTTAWTTGGNPVVNPLAVSAGVYQLIAANTNGCSDTALVTVTNYPKPNLGNDLTVNTCPGFPVNLTTLYNTAGLTAQWSTANPASAYAGVYSLYVTNTNGCRDTAVVTVNNYPKPDLGADKTVNICPGQTADITGLFNTAGLTIQWNTPTPAAVTAGSYTLIATNSNGCKDTANVTVAQYPPINVNITIIPSVISIMEGETVRLVANGTNIVSYAWQPPTYLSSASGYNITAQPLQTITYKLVVTNNGGCKDSALVNLRVLPLNLEPSGAFTPNGDGYTDKWIIKNILLTKQNKVSVFNRWGNKVFEATNYQNNWDGTNKGNPLPDGAYYYQIQATSMNGRVFNLTGPVTILR